MRLHAFIPLALLAAATARAGQPLTQDQIKSAIVYGASFDSRDKYLKKGAKVRTVIDLTPVGMTEMPLTFLGAWDYVAIRACEARRLMKPYTPEEAATIEGNLHAEVSISSVSRRGNLALDQFAAGSNLVIESNGKLIQPLAPPVARTGDAVLGKRAVLAFAYAVTPEDLALPVRVTFVRPKQKPITKTVDLSKILTVPTN